MLLPDPYGCGLLEPAMLSFKIHDYFSTVMIVLVIAVPDAGVSQESRTVLS